MDFDPYSEDNPNPLIFKPTNLFETFLISIVLAVAIIFFNYLLTSFYLPNTILMAKYCFGLIFGVTISAFPIIGFIFIIKIPFVSIEIISLLGLTPELNVWISFVLFFLISISTYVYNTIGFGILIKEYYFGIKDSITEPINIEPKGKTISLLSKESEQPEEKTPIKIIKHIDEDRQKLIAKCLIIMIIVGIILIITSDLISSSIFGIILLL